MPLYEYKCGSCGITFEETQSITEPPLTSCPECNGKVMRLIGGGAGFIIKGSSHRQTPRNSEACSLEQFGKTCCGRKEPCKTPACEED